MRLSLRHFYQYLAMVLLLGLGACGRVAPSGGADVADMPDMDVILAASPATHLSAYGLFKDASATEPANGVVGYDLINPLFSDHAKKDRLVFVPEGSAAGWRDNEVFAFPVGSVLIKSFSYAETGKIETRLLIHKETGWAAYPYVWNEAYTEAIYSPIGAKTQFETVQKANDGSDTLLHISYSVPNQNQCKTCHQAGDDIEPIGPKARNLGAKQVAKWRGLGLLQAIKADFTSVPSIARGEGGIDERARAYLDINCAHCHKADGAASNSGLWLDWTEESLVKLGIDKHPTAAGRGAGLLTRVIEPGTPEASILAFRMASDEAGVAMPELGRTLIDDEGVQLVHEWIAQMQND